MIKRTNNRQANELREIKITRNYTKYAEGSVLVEFGNTQVLCNVSVEESLPPFLKGKNQGWLTAEYSMLPRATHTRTKRDGVVGKVNSRAQEISRLIGRSLRACLDLELLGPRQLVVDCDVIQADGGTRTASITGGFIALHDAINGLLNSGKILFIFLLILKFSVSETILKILFLFEDLISCCPILPLQPVIVKFIFI